MTIRPWLTLRRCAAFVVVVATAMVSPDLASQGRRGRGPVLVDGREAVDGEVLVRFRNPAARFEQARAADEVEAEEVEALGLGTMRMRARRLRTPALLARLRANPDVEFAEPNYIIRLQAVPNDPGFGNLWGLLNSGQNYGGAGLAGADIDAALAWDVATGTRNHVVGVVDTGIDYTHPDLAANIWTAPAAFSVTIGGVVINCAAGTHGFSAITNTCDPMDDNNHGTHVAGTIGAVGNDGVGVVGVNWTASMMGLKFLDSTGTGTTANAIKAIEFAVQAKAVLGTAVANVRVLSNSYSGSGFSQSLLDEINRTNNADMLFVAAAGNSGLNIDAAPIFPASYATPNLIAVAATDNLDQRASFSNYGAATVHLGAPGVAILSTTINNTHGAFSGTSMAAPHVSGAAALLLSACSLTTAGLKAALLTAVDPIPAMAGVTTTGGRLNVNNAIRVCPPLSINVPLVIGLTQAAATTSLTGAGLAVGTVSTVTSATVAAGRVISQSPNGGTSVAPGTAVTLTVSLGPATAGLGLGGNLAFGPLPVGTTTARTLTISNTGNAMLIVNGISYPAGFSGNWTSGTIGAGGSQDVTVTFAPTAVSSYGGTVTVSGNQTSGTNTIAASGSGTAPSASTPTASFVGIDSTTQGTWKPVYGVDGARLATYAATDPGFAQVTVVGQQPYTWAAATTAVPALQEPVGTGRVAATWYSPTSFMIDVNLTDGLRHQVSLYALDWDSGGRSQRIEVLDGTTQAVLDTQMVSSFTGGQYWVWQVRGHVQFRISRVTGPNAVISALFFDAPDGAPGNAPPTVTLQGPTGGPWTAPAVVGLSATANDSDGSISQVHFYNGASLIGTSTSTSNPYTFDWLNVPAGTYSITAKATDDGTATTSSLPMTLTVQAANGQGPLALYAGTDSTTQGTWKPVYGVDGARLATYATTDPGFAQVTVAGQQPYTWAAATTAVPALQEPVGAGRVAATWYSPTSFTIDVNLTDGLRHQVSLYGLDWDSGGRSQRIEVLDGTTQAVLDTQMVGSFTGGQYWVWQVRGHVQFRITRVTGPNAVISALFFDASP